ncbi:uncharacterized protein MELLADRAFT_114432 [Melampsora larici-populina 98AG31]|uniref:F-box domain-containing protein n=1 Tax=Melampsora larici-populina (strain 98AG31 / pathotype 3-4-7) TaxID=747676 RepID=F4SDF8_MELLP|nr:uncharacterized protein MELLADRAFT_114432 [Melampsora larici-populina 98AG31]EGF97317.1 hypothetical protein MELLADRAFT_114432 [Melampsora larici-populina 98AG31]
MSTFPIPANPATRSQVLPVEVVDLIINQVMLQIPVIPSNAANSADIPSLRHEYITRLLRSRSLGRTWNNAIIPLVFKNLRLTRDPETLGLIEMWSKCFLTPGLPQLCHPFLDGIWYTLPSFKSLPGTVLSCSTLSYACSILPETAASLINLCGPTLITLKLCFVEIVGFSPALTSAIHKIGNLQTLLIQGSGSPHIIHDHESVKTLLEGTGSLKSLTIRFASLPSLHLRQGSLSNLTHFYISCSRKNLCAAIDICREEERLIDTLELYPPSNPDLTAGVAFGLATALKVLFIISIPDRVPHGMRMHVFPNLKVLRSEYSNLEKENLKWFKWPMLETIEVLVATYWSGNRYWRTVLEGNHPATFTVPPKLKHIVFTTPGSDQIRDPFLVDAFDVIGIKCHFLAPMNRVQILCSHDKRLLHQFVPVTTYTCHVIQSPTKPPTYAFVNRLLTTQHDFVNRAYHLAGPLAVRQSLWLMST